VKPFAGAAAVLFALLPGLRQRRGAPDTLGVTMRVDDSIRIWTGKYN